MDVSLWVLLKNDVPILLLNLVAASHWAIIGYSTSNKHKSIHLLKM